MKEADEARFAKLVSWATEHGAELHPAVEIYKDDVTGFSMRVKPTPEAGAPELKPGDSILTCPLKISLSYLNTECGGPILSPPSERTESMPVFPPKFMDLQPHIIGRFYLIKQYLLGKASFWHPYIATLPQPSNLSSWSLPPFWPEEDALFLEGTNAGIASAEIQAHIKKEFKDARRLLRDAAFDGWQDYTRLLYNWAFSMFASRSFRPSLVTSQAVRTLELPFKTGIDDFSVLLPVYDIINHDLRAKVRWAADERTCRLLSFDTYKPGEQIFNNYGKKTNSELLLAYGFMVPEAEGLHNDYVHLRKKTSPAQAEEGLGTNGTARDETGAAQSHGLEPRDFLVSLRPMHHPSSLVGKARQMVCAFRIRDEFAHVEDSLVWDLCISGMSNDDKAAFMDAIGTKERPDPTSPPVQPDDRNPELTATQQLREHRCLRGVLDADKTTELPEVNKAKEVLLAKLGMEYDKLCETGAVGVDEETGEEVEIGPENRNQELAMLYRAQSKRVLENAIAALVPGWEGAAD